MCSTIESLGYIPMFQWSLIERKLTEKEVGKGGNKQFVGSLSPAYCVFNIHIPRLNESG